MMQEFKIGQTVKIIRDDSVKWNYATTWYPSVGIIGVITEVYGEYIRIDVPREYVEINSKHASINFANIVVRKTNTGRVDDPVENIILDIKPETRPLSLFDRIVKRYMLGKPNAGHTENRANTIIQMFAYKTFQWSEEEFARIEKIDLDFKHPNHQGYTVNEESLYRTIDDLKSAQLEYVSGTDLTSIYMSDMYSQSIKNQKQLIDDFLEKLKNIDDLCSDQNASLTIDVVNGLSKYILITFLKYSDFFNNLPIGLEQSHYDGIAQLMNGLNNIKLDDSLEGEKRDFLFQWMIKNQTLKTSENRFQYLSEIK